MKNQIIILFLVVIFGCKKDVQPTQPIGGANGDDVLRSKIVGLWKAGSAWSYTFRADSTFVDSFFTPKYLPDTIVYEIVYVAKGKYSINNAVLTYPQMELVYADTSYLLSFNNMTYYIYYHHKIEFKNEVLVLNLLEILSPVNGDGKVVTGKWEAENWIAQMERRPAATILFGKIKKEYQFDEATHKYNYTITNNYASLFQVLKDSGSFIYTSNRLSFNTNITIPEFLNGKLYLNYISWPIFHYEKIQ